MACYCEMPPALRVEQARLKALGGRFLGSCGDENHTYGFHLPSCRLGSGDYSLRYGRGNGLWSAAIDIGMNFAHSRDWLVHLVAQASAGRRPGVVEIIGKPAGKPVLYWAKWNGWKAKTYTGSGHDTWTHVGCDRSVLARGSGVDLHLLDWSYTGGGGGGSPAPATPPEVTAVRRLPMLRKGATGGYVRNAQALLVARGRSIKIDGKLGDQTTGAVRAEQREYGLDDDGIIGLHTWSTLHAARRLTAPADLPTLRKGASGSAVRSLQALLVANGRSIKIDGKFGPQTDSALYAEQREYGITADRIAGGHSWATLIARRKS